MQSIRLPVQRSSLVLHLLVVIARARLRLQGRHHREGSRDQSRPREANHRQVRRMPSLAGSGARQATARMARSANSGIQLSAHFGSRICAHVVTTATLPTSPNCTVPQLDQNERSQLHHLLLPITLMFGRMQILLQLLALNLRRSQQMRKIHLRDVDVREGGIKDAWLASQRMPR